MFGLPVGIPEILVILLVAVVLFGGKLPETARSLGRTWKEFQRGLHELKEQVSLDEDLDLKKDIQEALYQEVETEWPDEEAEEEGEEEEGVDPYTGEEDYDEFYRSMEEEEEGEEALKDEPPAEPAEPAEEGETKKTVGEEGRESGAAPRDGQAKEGD